MSQNIEQRGYPSIEELKANNLYPSEERFKDGPVVLVECTQEIPCNPCEQSCPFGAIKVGEPITNIPIVDMQLCTGCGICISQCPGLAIFVVDKTYSAQTGTITFPYEYYPLLKKGQIVEAVNRDGTVICQGKVLKAAVRKSYDHTAVITVEIPLAFTDQVRSIKIKKDQTADDDLIICRCEEITRREIIQAIKEGAIDPTGVKRRTRAGLGLCQGRTCELLIQRILAEQLNKKIDQIAANKDRPPVRPILLKTLGGTTNEK